MKRDTLGAIELKILLEKGVVEVFRDTDVIDSLRIAEKVTKDNITLQKAVINEYKSLQEHIFNGETIFLRFNDSIQKGQTDKDGNEGHWITTQDGNKAFIGSDGKLRFSAEQISAYVDEKESKENVKEEVKETKPDIVDKLEANKWNGKFYGKEGKWTAYLNGKETKISDEEKQDYEKYKSKQKDSKKDEPVAKTEDKNKINLDFNVIKNKEEFDNFANEVKGKKINFKVYGKEGNYSIYVNGDKKEISDNVAETLIKTNKIVNPIEDGIVDDNGLTKEDYASLIRNTIDGDSIHANNIIGYAKELNTIKIDKKELNYVNESIKADLKLKIITAYSKNNEGNIVSVMGKKDGKDFNNKSSFMSKNQLQSFLEKYGLK